ncbi:MAG: hypothetical protein O0V67_05790 [Methanocorpusculum sp.]|nr:hypothetical protein [Methanocorpusculum sp.]
MEAFMNLTLGQIVGRIAGVIAVLSIFIEITPVKINPISALLRWIGKQTNKELMDKVSTLETKVGALEKSDVVDCRVRILTFADEIRRGVRHSKETFDQVLSDIDTYERYCKEHPDFMNNKTVAAKAKILDIYSECMDKNDFL